MSEKPKQGTGEHGWKPEEKGPDASGNPGDAGEAGDAEAKGRPKNEREHTESVATKPQPGPKSGDRQNG